MEDNKIEEAKKLIEEENRKKFEQCQKEIEEILKKYNAELLIYPEVVIQGQKQHISIQIK